MGPVVPEQERIVEISNFMKPNEAAAELIWELGPEYAKELLRALSIKLQDYPRG